MSKTIDSAQIERLFRFTREHFVYHFDVQSELVKDLKLSIESQWQTNPNLDFEQALDNAFKAYGIFGFQDVVEGKNKAVNKIYLGIVWSHFKAFFTTNKIAYPLAIFLMLYLLFIVLGEYPLVPIAVSSVILTYGFIQIIKNFKKQKQQQKNNTNQRKYLFDDYFLGLEGQSLGIINFLNFYHLFYLNIYDFLILNSWVMMVLILFMTLIVILFYVLHTEIPKQKDYYLNLFYQERENLNDMPVYNA